MKHIITSLTASIVLIFCACSSNDSHKVIGDGEGWTIKGTITGAADSTIYIEASTMNNWYAVDSLCLDNEDSFSFTQAAPDTIGNIYRVRLGSQYVYFPILGNEQIELTADIKNFGASYKLTGSKAAENFAFADGLIKQSLDSLGIDKTIDNNTLRKQLNLIINQDTTCLVSYYLINKRIGPDFIPFYNIVNPADLKTLGNVANNFAHYRPNDARTKELETLYLNARREVNKRLGRASVIEYDPNTAISRPEIDITLYDAKGQQQDFNKVLALGIPVVLNITRFYHPDSPLNTVELNKVYERYGKNGIQIYQVAFDVDEIAWKQQAASMPWISVWATRNTGNEIMINYNVNPNATPTSFVFDRKGQLVERVSDPTKLAVAVEKIAN